MATQSSVEMKAEAEKGSRITVCHAGSNKIRFVTENKLIFHSKQKQVNSDYHSEMNTGDSTWFINDLTPSIKQLRFKIISIPFASSGDVN